VLLPPWAGAGVCERGLRPGCYRRRGGKGDDGSGSGNGTGTEGGEEKGDGEAGGEEQGLELVLEEGADEVPFAIWDPDRPTENATRYSALLQPMRVTLNPGDMLYLPCMWWVTAWESNGWEADRQQVPQGLAELLAGGGVHRRQLLVRLRQWLVYTPDCLLE
jgi:jumonji domain-containing protein 7